VLEREGIRARGLDVEVAPEVVEALVEKGYSPAHGARYLQREIERTLTAALAVEIARQPLAPGTPVKVVAFGGKVHALAEPRAREAAGPTAEARLPAAGAQVARRKLDARALLAEAEALMSRAARLASAAHRPHLEASRKELLTLTQAATFWDDGERAAGILRAYREQDLKLGELDRVRELCLVARRRSREARSETALAQAVRALEEAAQEVRLAEARVAAGSTEVDDAWLEVAGADSAGAEGWVRELTHMYLGWAARRGYTAQVVAEGEEPLRAVLHLQGTGVYGFLSGERGVHRRTDEQHRVTAYVRLYQPSLAPQELPASVTLEGREVKRRAGRFVEKLAAEVSVRDEATGRLATLRGGGTLAELKGLALLVLAGQGDGGEDVRRYSLGAGARVEDPRTGEGTPRTKEVMRGEIDRFIAAWMTRPPDSSA